LPQVQARLQQIRSNAAASRNYLISELFDRYPETPTKGGYVMVKMNKCKSALGAAFVLGLAVSAIATPSFAQRSEHDEAGGTRARAIQECSREASKYKQTTWGSQEVTMYRACMGAHGQRE
jgi:hypothetical protein